MTPPCDDAPGSVALSNAIDAHNASPWRKAIATVGRLTGHRSPYRLDDADTMPIPVLTPGPARTPCSTDAIDPMAVIGRIQAGDRDAFGLFYDHYVCTVFRFVYFRVGDRHLAEDLTSDTFLRALKHVGGFTWQGRDPGAWLVTIARNLVANHRRSPRHRLEVTTDGDLDMFRPGHSREGNPEADVIDHLTSVELRTAVKQLKAERRDVIVLRFLHGLSVAETAAALDISAAAVKMRQGRALCQLARMLPDGVRP